MAHFNRRTILVSSTAGVLLLLILTGIWILHFERQARTPVGLAARAARGSAEIRQLLGEPLRVARFTRGTLFSNRGEGNADLILHIVGPLGRGTLYEWAQEVGGKWLICYLQFRSSNRSTNITLVDDSSTHCERE